MKTVDFSETVAACDLKVSRYRQLFELMKVCIEGQGHFLTFAQGQVHMKIKTCFSQKPLGHFQPNFVYKHLGTMVFKIHQHYAGHMTKIAAMPIYGKNYFKNPLSRY